MVRRLSPSRRLKLATCVLDDLRRIFQSIRLSARRAERDLGISGAQLFVLQKLVEAPADSLNQLSQRTLTHQSSVSVVVQRLVERGLVARERSEDDARRIVLRLTSAGRLILRRSPPTPQAKLVNSIQSMKDGELRLVATLMQQLARATRSTRLRPEMMFAKDARAAGAGRRKTAAGKEGRAVRAWRSDKE